MTMIASCHETLDAVDGVGKVHLGDEQRLYEQEFVTKNLVIQSNGIFIYFDKSSDLCAQPNL